LLKTQNVVIPFTVNRGKLRAEESLFCRIQTRRFLTSFGMATKALFPQTSETAPTKIRGFHKESETSIFTALIFRARCFVWGEIFFFLALPETSGSIPPGPPGA